MKNTIKTIAVLSMILMTFVQCKKEESNKESPQWIDLPLAIENSSDEKEFFANADKTLELFDKIQKSLFLKNKDVEVIKLPEEKDQNFKLTAIEQLFLK